MAVIADKTPERKPADAAPATKSKARDQNATAVLELLAEQWPGCFSIYEFRRRPLKIGIHLDIIAALDGAITPRELSCALRVYVRNKVYRSRLTVGAVRISLAGEPAGVVTPEEIGPKPETLTKQTAPAVSPSPQPAAPRRLSLADLRAAAARRRGAGNDGGRS